MSHGHEHAHGHAHAPDRGHHAQAPGRAPGKETLTQHEPAGPIARGSHASLFAQAKAAITADEESGEHEHEEAQEHERDQEQDHDPESGEVHAKAAYAGGKDTDHGVAVAAKATSNPYKPGGNRPHIRLTKSIKGIDEDGRPARAKKGWKPAVSVVAGNEAVLYLGGQNLPKGHPHLLLVKVSKLERAVAAGSRKNLERIKRIRKLRTTKKPKGALHRVEIPPGLGQGWKPTKTGGESLTGRGAGPIIWGTTNPTGPDGSGSGFVALPMHTGTAFRVVKEKHMTNTPWVRPDGIMGTAVWAKGWAHVHGKWVLQWMVSKILGADSSVISFLS